MLRLTLPVLLEQMLHILVGFTDLWLTGNFLPGEFRNMNVRRMVLSGDPATETAALAPGGAACCCPALGAAGLGLGLGCH